MSKDVALTQYQTAIEKALKRGDSTEHTHRPALKTLIETLFPEIEATNEPKRIKCGAPDYVLTAGSTPLGYIEAKDVDVSLDREEKSEQLKRYRESLGNLILTDYLEFRWFVGGEKRMIARLATTGAKGQLKPESNGIDNVRSLLTAFRNTTVGTVGNPKELAERMAATARLIRDTIRRAFESEYKGGTLHSQYVGFKQVLLPDLTVEQFADMYAQTICYGLFAARCASPKVTGFTREGAVKYLPKTNPFLRKMFGYIAYDLDESITWAVDDLAELLNHSDMAAILKDFGKRTRQQDPIVHFYETFLTAYDPKIREARGVYYTPEPVVSYIVRSVDYLLKKDFGLPMGLADSEKIKIKSPDGKTTFETHKVQILDPATGTATFLHGVIDQIYDSFKGNEGMWPGYVKDDLLPRITGFELLMAPYTVAHMKLGLQLQETGYTFDSDERLQIYLTNTLEEGYEGGRLPFAEWLVEEATAASNVKYDAPVMVVLGNPPYSGHSFNNSLWINLLLHGQYAISQGNNKPPIIRRDSKMDSYFEVDSKPLDEKNPKWVNNDYVRVIRFAQWRIERTGYGILAFITDHSYLDSPTFRGMRQSLMRTFDEIYILDLHGDGRRKEKSPDGSPDINVFDILQGVAISIFVKKPGHSSELAAVRHAQKYGLREVKYQWLWENDLNTTEWEPLKPQASYYYFIPLDTDLLPEYEKGWKITDILRVNSVGIVTGQDANTIARSRKEAENLAQLHKLPETVIEPILYRPFDIRYITYDKKVIARNRLEVMRHMLAGRNLALITSRLTKGETFKHAQVTRNIVEVICMSPKTSNNGFVFPLYLYPDNSIATLFDLDGPNDAPGGRRSNLSSVFTTEYEERLGIEFIKDGKGNLQKSFGPEDVFHYIYAVLHSSSYRERYADFLKKDFPRIPITSNLELFQQLCGLGEQLVGLHLMEKYGPTITRYPVIGNSVIEDVIYAEPKEDGTPGRVIINKTQYIEGVPPEVWEFHIGGYQVCQKWLKDHKGRKLENNDLIHYQHIVAALAETIRFMSEIDEVIEEHGGWPIQ